MSSRQQSGGASPHYAAAAAARRCWCVHSNSERDSSAGTSRGPRRSGNKRKTRDPRRTRRAARANGKNRFSFWGVVKPCRVFWASSSVYVFAHGFRLWGNMVFGVFRIFGSSHCAELATPAAETPTLCGKAALLRRNEFLPGELSHSPGRTTYRWSRHEGSFFCVRRACLDHLTCERTPSRKRLPTRRGLRITRVGGGYSPRLHIPCYSRMERGRE